MCKQGKGKLFFKTLIISLIFFVSGCGTTGESISAITPSPTATETPIPLPTATVEPTMTPVPDIPEEFADQIDHQETLPDGRVVAVADTGKRILQINQETKEWIPYEKQIGVVKENFLGRISVPSIPEEMKKPLPEGDIHRIHDEKGNLIPFGYLPQYREEYESSVGPACNEYFSGIVRGYLKQDKRSFLVIEFPHQFGDSQYLEILKNSTSTIRYPGLKKFYEGNIDNSEGGLSDKMIGDGLKKPEAIGHQIMFALGDFDGKEAAGNLDEQMDFAQAQDEFFEMMKKGQIYNNENGYAGLFNNIISRL